ncbi:MAG TPA: hypothetical protein VNM48_00155 [Chloroflexota bacterium]|nr:hypothetical protein [Chloroflexota bacterium]
MTGETAHEHTGAEAMEAALTDLQRAPLVKLAIDCFEFYDGDVMAYDLTPSSSGDALRWIEHLAQKTWVTKEHLEQFARLAASHFGAGYR